MAKKQLFIPYSLLVITSLFVICMSPNVDVFNLQIDNNIFLYLYFFMFLVQGLLMLVSFLLYERIKSFALPNFNELSLLMRYGLVAFLGNVSYFILLKMDFWTLRFFNKDATAYGNYTAASRTIQMFLIVAMIASASFFVNTADPEEQRKGKRVLLKLIRVLLIFYFSVAMFFVIFGAKIFVFLYGESFSGMYLPFLYFLPGMFALSIVTLMGSYFGGNNKIVINTITNVVGILVIVVLSFLILPTNNSPLVSAIISSLGYMAAAVFVMFQFKRSTEFKLIELLQFSKADFDWVPKILKRIGL